MDAFTRFCREFTDEPIPHVKIGRRYYYDPHGLLAYAQEARWDAFAVGLYLGEERKDFFPTSALIDLLAKHDTRRVAVGDKAAWLFLCGRDILMDGVYSAGNISPNTRVIVSDVREQVIGFGRVVAPYHPSMKNKTYLKHVLDRGEYLRRER
jgi:ribosome biogenesis protein Nip4